MKTLKTYDIWYHTVIGGRCISVNAYSLFRSLKKVKYSLLKNCYQVVINDCNVVPDSYLRKTLDKALLWHEKNNH